MGLNSNDPIPNDLTLREAYLAVRAWYQSNTVRIEKYNDTYAKASIALVKALPAVNSLTELEIRAVFDEVIRGHLEWGYHGSDGKYKMAAYAQGALEAAGYGLFLSQEDLEPLRESRLWPYLTTASGYLLKNTP